MSKKDFNRFVDQASKEKKSKKIDWKKRREEWVLNLDKFYDGIQSFLNSFIKKGKITIEFKEIELTEEHIGTYKTKSATILIGNYTILLRPIGTTLIAAKGRVDMTGAYGKVKFVLVPESANKPQISAMISTEYMTKRETEARENGNEKSDWVWKIATSPPAIRYLLLDEESFMDAVIEVTNADSEDSDG